MGKGTIISHTDDGLYQVQLNFHGASRIDAKIAALENLIDDLDDQIALLPDGTEKNILKLKKASLEKYVEWYEGKKIEDVTVNLWCADLTDDLTGEVGIIEIPGERQSVLIRPGYNGNAAYNQNRDGQLQPVIASSPSVTFINLSVFPGWQKWKPMFRKGIISNINYANNKCDVCIDAEFSSQLNINVNQEGDWSDCEAAAHSGYVQFCSNNPTHPICTNSTIGNSLFVTSAMFNELNSINNQVNSAHEYQNDQSGYNIGDYWAIMGAGEKGDCEDFTLTKMDELINAGWSASNLQIALCYTETGGYHAVLLIRSSNMGNLILDNRYTNVRDQSALPYAWDRVQVAGSDWALYSMQITNVDIEYMTCNAAAFVNGDYVVVEFTNQDWDDPKVIGFVNNPEPCDFYIYCCLGSYMGHPYGTLQYNVLSDSWIGKSVMKGPYDAYNLSRAVYMRYGNYGWVFGGYTSQMLDPWHWVNHVLNTTYAYNSVAEIWNIGLPNFNGRSRSEPGGFNLDSKGYCVAGCEYPAGNVWEPPPLEGILNDVDEFNFNNQTWAVKNNFSTLAGGDGYSAGNGKGYMLGGKSTDWTEAITGPVRNPLSNTNKEYDQDLDSWMDRNPFQGGRVQLTVFEIDGYGYITGGFLRWKTFPGDNDAFWYGDEVYITANCQKNDWVSQVWITQANQHNYAVDRYGVKNGVNNKGFKVNNPLGLQIYNPATMIWSASSTSGGFYPDSADIPREGGAFSA
jgi:predicted transglutaminase-like cysteine proteinase